jgi:pilus assembly protein CpaB
VTGGYPPGAAQPGGLLCEAQLLRRSKTIAFDDEPSSEAMAGSGRPSLRRNLDSLRASLRVAPEAEPEIYDSEPPVADNPVHQRFDQLRNDLEQSPISKGSQESLAALREEFRRKHLGNTDEIEAGPAMPSFTLGGLKPSRLILLLVAIVAAGLAAWLAVGRPPEPAPVVEQPVVAPAPVPAPTLEVLVAKQSIAVGTRLTAELLEWQKWPEEAVRGEYITSAATPEAIADFAGSIARREIIAGEPIRRETLGEAGAGYLSAILDPGKRAVSVSINASSASGGFIAPNDRVDVVLTRATETQLASYTILSNVRVLAINARLGGSEETTGTETPQDGMFSDNALATLELDSTQAELIINATGSGTLSLVLRPMADTAAGVDTTRDAINQSVRLTSPFWRDRPPADAVSSGTPPKF